MPTSFISYCNSSCSEIVGSLLGHSLSSSKYFLFGNKVILAMRSVLVGKNRVLHVRIGTGCNTQGLISVSCISVIIRDIFLPPTRTRSMERYKKYFSQLKFTEMTFQGWSTFISQSSPHLGSYSHFRQYERAK